MKKLLYTATTLLSVGFMHAQVDNIVADLSDLARGKNAKLVFSEIISSSKPTVVKFYTPGCPPCKNISKHVEKLAVEYKEKAQFIGVDASSFKEISKSYKIQKVPTFIIFKQSKKIETLVGSGNFPKISPILEKLTKE